MCWAASLVLEFWIPLSDTFLQGIINPTLNSLLFRVLIAPSCHPAASQASEIAEKEQVHCLLLPAELSGNCENTIKLCLGCLRPCQHRCHKPQVPLSLGCLFHPCWTDEGKSGKCQQRSRTLLAVETQLIYYRYRVSPSPREEGQCQQRE